MTPDILIIDDHKATLELLNNILSRQGYRVRLASSGKAGLDQVAKRLPDLILLDINMPGMDGFQVLEILREQQTTSHIPVIMFSAKSQAESKLSGFNMGANDYLVKPTSPRELLRRVEAQLSRNAAGTNNSANEAVAESIREAQESQLISKIGRSKQANTKTADPTGFEPLPKMPNNQHLIAVLGSRGGAGVTTIAINLAYSLANDGLDTILADLDLAQGHVAHYLRQRVVNGLENFSLFQGQTLQRRIRDSLVSKDRHLRLLLATGGQQDDLPPLSPSQIQTMIATLVAETPYVVADLGRGINDMNQVVLEKAITILLCVRPERVSLSAARQMLHVMREKFGEDHNRLRVILVNSQLQRSLPKNPIEHFLNYPLFDVLNLSESHITQATNMGESLLVGLPESESSQDIIKFQRRLLKTAAV